MANIEALERNLQETVEEKNIMKKEMEDIRGSRDNLKIKIEEMEANIRETLCKNDSEVERLKKELRDQVFNQFSSLSRFRKFSQKLSEYWSGTIFAVLEGLNYRVVLVVDFHGLIRNFALGGIEIDIV